MLVATKGPALVPKLVPRRPSGSEMVIESRLTYLRQGFPSLFGLALQ